MPLPTFVIVGVQKCGTSTLAATLRRHPQIYMARPKELHFFDFGMTKGLEWYADQFPVRPKHTAWGEATPRYLYDDDARRRMAETLPETSKFLAILRDPAKRAYSHYWHSRWQGSELLETFEEALDREPERLQASTRERMNHSYVDRGRYLRQLEALAADVGRDRIMVHLLDDLSADWEGVLTRTFEFLGVKTAPASTIPLVWANPATTKKTEDGSKQAVEKYPPIKPETRARLVEEFRDDNEALGEWLGRDLSSWNRV